MSAGTRSGLDRALPGKPSAADTSRLRTEIVGPAQSKFQADRSAFIKQSIEKGRKHRLERNKALKQEFLSHWAKKVAGALKGDPKKLAAMNVSGAAGDAPADAKNADRSARKNVTVDGTGFPKEMDFQKPQSEEERLRQIMKDEGPAPNTVEEGIHGQ